MQNKKYGMDKPLSSKYGSVIFLLTLGFIAVSTWVFIFAGVARLQG